MEGDKAQLLPPMLLAAVSGSESLSTKWCNGNAGAQALEDDRSLPRNPEAEDSLLAVLEDRPDTSDRLSSLLERALDDHRLYNYVA